MDKRNARGNSNRLNRRRRLNFEALQARTVLSATLPSFSSAMDGEHARPAMESTIDSRSISMRDPAPGMHDSPEAHRSMLERVDRWADQHAPPDLRAGLSAINVHNEPPPPDFHRLGDQRAPLWSSPAPPLYLQQRLFVLIEINRSTVMPPPTVNELAGPQLSQPRLESTRSITPAFNAPPVKPLTLQANNPVAFVSVASLSAPEAPSTPRFIILPSASIATQTDSYTLEGNDSWSTQATFDSEGSYDAQLPATAEQSQARAKAADSGTPDEEQPTYDDFIEIEGDTGSQLPSSSASKPGARQPKHSAKPTDSDVVDEIWSEFIGQDELASPEGQDVVVPVEPSLADAALLGRQFSSDEGGMIELALSSDTAAAQRGAKGGPRIDETEVKMDAGVGLFQAFEMGTAPGQVDGVTADDTGRPTARPAKSAVKKTDAEPLRSAAMAPGVGIAAMVLSGLERAPEQRHATRLARPRRDRRPLKGLS